MFGSILYHFGNFILCFPFQVTKIELTRTRAVKDPTQSSIFWIFYSVYIHLIEIQSMAEQQHPATSRVCTTVERACLGCSQRLFSMPTLPTREPGANITRETYKSIQSPSHVSSLLNRMIRKGQTRNSPLTHLSQPESLTDVCRFILYPQD